MDEWKAKWAVVAVAQCSCSSEAAVCRRLAAVGAAAAAEGLVCGKRDVVSREVVGAAPGIDVIVATRRGRHGG